MFKNISSIDSKSKVLLESLKPFYDKQKNKKILKEIISGNSSISLRVLDWFVSNYSKKNGTSYTIKEDIEFNVHAQYKARLKSFSKKLFDPFRRGEKIILVFITKKDKENIQTTVGQLNFFKWCIEKDILIWLKDNIKDVEKDMNEIQQSSKKEKQDKKNTKIENKVATKEEKTKQKRQQLSKSVLKTMNKKRQNVIIDFT